jgi:phenylacetate-CoA ligase
VIVEFIAQDRPASPGEMGRVVCTGLHAFAMPFIRYDLGDVALPDDRRCPCGRGLPMMRGIVGRADDFFVARDGSVRSPSLLVNNVKQIAGISRFHLTQRRDRRILARIVPGDGFDDEARAHLVSLVQEIMADGSEVDVKVVPEIPADPARKVRCLISRIPRDF